jgi:tyrosyl-tRNA synthetase
MVDEDGLGPLLSNVSEVVTKSEFEELMREKTPVRVYAGYEPSGKIHLGHAISVYKLVELQGAGAEVVVLLADLHAYLNSKGSLEEIRRIAEYNKECFISLGLDKKKTEFILGSDIQLEPDYFMNVQRLALTTTLLRAKRSMDVISGPAKDSHARPRQPP